jgi:peroxiredoxin Q/BCP
MTKQAPDFQLLDQDGTSRSLADYAGRWLVIYFYPKDDTSGCTAEACKFRDERDVIAELGNAEIVGISKDTVRSHKKFIEKNSLNFTLLSDPEHTTIEAYSSWSLKKFMGREYMGTDRNTFIIDPAGKIVKEYLGVNPSEHVLEIIKDLQTLQAKI